MPLQSIGTFRFNYGTNVLTIVVFHEKVIILNKYNYLMELPVHNLIHCGIGRFCFSFFANFCLILNVLCAAWNKRRGLIFNVSWSFCLNFLLMIIYNWSLDNILPCSKILSTLSTKIFFKTLNQTNWNQLQKRMWYFWHL